MARFKSKSLGILLLRKAVKFLWKGVKYQSVLTTFRIIVQTANGSLLDGHIMNKTTTKISLAASTCYDALLKLRSSVLFPIVVVYLVGLGAAYMLSFVCGPIVSAFGGFSVGYTLFDTWDKNKEEKLFGVGTLVFLGVGYWGISYLIKRFHPGIGFWLTILCLLVVGEFVWSKNNSKSK